MHIRYRELFKLEYNGILYKSMMDDTHRTVINYETFISYIIHRNWSLQTTSY